MEYGAIDLHKKESQVRLLTADGAVIDQRIPTTRDRLTTLFWGRPRMRILLEASTESEWVAQHLEGMGHEVIVADPNFGLMYGHRSRRVKTDRRDVAALAEACRHGTYRPAHRRSAAQRTVQWHLTLRRELVDTRTRLIAIVRAITRSTGHRIPSGSAETFLRRLDALALPEAIRTSLAAVDPVLPILDAEVAKVDTYLEALVDTDPRVQRLTTCPMIGPVTAVAFVAALDDVQRFAGRRRGASGQLPGACASRIQLGRAPATRTRAA